MIRIIGRMLNTRYEGLLIILDLNWSVQAPNEYRRNH